MGEMKDHSTRAHALLSASSSERWLACPPSAVAAAKYPNPDTDYTREGTLAHEVAETVANGILHSEAFFVGDEIDPEMRDCALSYAYYIQEQIKGDDAVVLLEQRVDYSAWVPDGFGTCDCILIQQGTLIIIDFKYGQGVAVEAVDNPQMRLYALGAYNILSFVYDIDKVETHIYQPRKNNISKDIITVDELLAWGEKIKPIAAQAAKGKGKYNPGSHCTFCPHAGRCRALTKICNDYVETHGMRVAVPVLAPHEIAQVLQMEPLVSLWLKRVRDQALTDMLNGKEVPGYKVVEGKPGNRAWTDELQIMDKLVAAGYTQEDITETKLLSPAKMDKALGKKKAAELLAGMTTRNPGAPTIAPVTDKRPAYDRLAEAQKDFEQ